MLTMNIHQESCQTGRLQLNASAWPAMARTKASVIDITPYFAPERDRVESFIRDVYAKAYGASIGIDYPILMSVRTTDGEILGALGFRYAAQAPLFLEHYTGQPIEACLSEHYQQTVARRDIVEIGNLASAGGGTSLYLFAALSSYLHARGIRYATITGTAQLQERLHKLGLDPRLLCPAHPSLLAADEQQRWGSYYEQQPRVLSGSVAEGVSHLRSALGLHYEEAGLVPLLPRLHFKGQP